MPGPIGRLRHRIAIQDRSDTVDPQTGAQAVAWSTVATVWARVDPMTSREAIEAGVAVGSLGYRITMRGGTDVTSDQRISWTHRGTTRLLQVEGLPRDPSGDGHWSVYEATETGDT